MEYIFILQYSDFDSCHAVEAHLTEEGARERWKECMEAIGLDNDVTPYSMGRDQQSVPDTGATYWIERVKIGIKGD